MTALAQGQTVRVIRQGHLRRFKIALDGKVRPGLFSSERAAVAAFGFTDSELTALKAAKATTSSGAIGLADLAAFRATITAS